RRTPEPPRTSGRMKYALAITHALGVSLAGDVTTCSRPRGQLHLSAQPDRVKARHQDLTRPRHPSERSTRSHAIVNTHYDARSSNGPDSGVAGLRGGVYGR